MPSEQPTDGIDRTADEWEAYLEAHPDEVLLFVGGDYEIHTFEHDPDEDRLTFVRGGRLGYNYEGSRSALEAFADDDADAHKLVPRDEETAERRRLVDGEYETVHEWIRSGPSSTETTQDGGRDD